ncbi:hypothetical protein [Streptomyces spiralis]|uniref:hypothetical protein n=1 Tax=Streptomyces spiralis TaxID=66376 RepID=UPI0036BEE773
MTNPHDASFATEPPVDLPLSTKVKALRKAYQDAEEAYTKYRQENAAYAARNVTREYDSKSRYEIPALIAAERELRELEIAAVAAGKPLPDKDRILGPVKAKADEYARTVPALRTLADKAKREYFDALKDELVTMGLKEAQKAAKARQEWESAYNAAMEAKASLERHSGLFTWCVSQGDMETAPRTGHSQGDNLERWELNSDGMLTWEASQALDYLDWLVKVPGLIEPNPNPPAAEEFNHNPKPRHFIAKDAGYGNNWEF